jgi:hypothetical protein
MIANILRLLAAERRRVKKKLRTCRVFIVWALIAMKAAYEGERGVGDAAIPDFEVLRAPSPLSTHVADDLQEVGD